MGALAVAVAKDRKNVVPSVVQMLDTMGHRGRDAHGIAANDALATAGTTEQLATSGSESNIALGQNLARIIPEDAPQPVQADDLALVFEGRLFPSLGGDEAVKIAKTFSGDPLEGARHLIVERDGSYAFACSQGGRMVAGRDPVGTVPLYYGESKDLYALASERKALWTLGICDVKSFPPGNIAAISRSGMSLQNAKTITKPLIRHVDEGLAAKELYALLLESTRNRVTDSGRVALAFSGGLDSSVIAFFAKECGAEVSLISVGLEGQPEMQHAEHVAEKLDLPFTLAKFTSEDVENVFSRVLWLVEEPDALKVSIALPIFWAAETASRLDCRTLLAAQGSDELFGGYHRYLGEFRRAGADAVENALFHDTVSSYEVNFERDDKVCAFHQVELRLPFCDLSVILSALSLPVNMKIASAEDPLRKRVLRKLAKEVGLPPEVYDRPKRAIQYETGVDKALRKLAKAKGLKLQELVEQSFRSQKVPLQSRHHQE